jgi:hypothetical protein
MFINLIKLRYVFLVGVVSHSVSRQSGMENYDLRQRKLKLVVNEK